MTQTEYDNYLEIIPHSNPNKVMFLSEGFIEDFARRGNVYLGNLPWVYIFGRRVYVDENQKEPLIYKRIIGANMSFLKKVKIKGLIEKV